ncbi:hypothetical protein BDW59DRAFT_96770 [Aspergillus cavernicola]|uniref:Uncharacterized protein n=1 Tax=Aspergillus cavernicola TaxID=176166 RepID=A0ABR4I845_9EURO
MGKPLEGLIPRFRNRKESEIELVVPGDNPAGSPTETLFSVEATAQDQSTPQDELRLLLGIKHLDGRDRIAPPKQLRWMHMSNNGMEFNTFLRHALEAYGIDQQTQSSPISKFFDRFVAICEQSAFRGGRFQTIPASTTVQLPGNEEKVKVNFMAIPYFLLQNAQSPPKPTGSRTKVHWAQPLVQSGYHLDSSMAREHQQAIRRLHSHITQIIHVPQLWILSIGDKFLATCSPTPLHDGQRSSITTRTIGRNAFPPTIRVTTASGFVFCLERSKCTAWFEFLYRVQSMTNASRTTSVDTRNWTYRLETDGSLIEAYRWRSLLQLHPDGEPLFILASPREPSPSKELTGAFVPELRYPSDISRTLKERDQRVLEHRNRRIRAMENSDGFSRQYIAHPYYWPPGFVLDAARSQVARDRDQSPGQSTSQTIARVPAKGARGGPEKQSIFEWSIWEDPSKATPTPADKPTSTRRMKALLAYLHRDFLFLSAIRPVRVYNELSLQTKSSIDKQIVSLRETYLLNSHILDLVSAFVRSVSDILDHFIDSDYDCIVKGKVWAAVSIVIQVFQFGLVDTLSSFQAEILAIPFNEVMRQIQSLRDGLADVADPSIPPSLVDAFTQIVVLLVDLAFEASRLIAKMEQSSNPSAPSPSENTQSNTDETDDDSAKTVDHTLPYSPNRLIDQIFAYLDQAQDEFCATFRGEDEDESLCLSGLGTIISLVLESVLRGHSTCDAMPILNIAEVYATYTTSLQLEARNRPSKNLLLDINLLREELQTIVANISQQLTLITNLRSDDSGREPDDDTDSDDDQPLNFETLFSPTFDRDVLMDPSARAILQETYANLQEQKDVFTELIKRADLLEKQIVQRVDIIQEDHGKAILIFTIVSTIFLPLSFVSSYLGMNTADIRDMEPSQALFWQVATPFTLLVVSVVLGVAYNGGRILEWLSRGSRGS